MIKVYEEMYKSSWLFNAVIYYLLAKKRSPLWAFLLMFPVFGWILLLWLPDISTDEDNMLHSTIAELDRIKKQRNQELREAA